MQRVETTLAWIEARKLKDMLKGYHKDIFAAKALSSENQIKKAILAIIKSYSHGYYTKSKKEFKQSLINWTYLISECVANIDKLSQKRPELRKICYILKEQTKKIDKTKRHLLKTLKKRIKPKKKLSLFERLAIYRKSKLQTSTPISNLNSKRDYTLKAKGFQKRIKLKIAGIIIQMKSNFKMKSATEEDSWRFNNFIYKRSKRPHINLEVKIVKDFPKLKEAKRLFLTMHPDSQSINWALYKRNNRYILRAYPANKKQHIDLNTTFNKGIVYLLLDKKRNLTWDSTNVIYDSLQIILINYLSKRDGIFVHAMGLKDTDNKGRIFIGQTFTGKTTLARIWHKYSRAKILNDDRIIIRKIGRGFFIYSSPWHGDFSDYLISKTGSAKPVNLLFIRHGRKNSLQPVSKKKAFGLLHPNLFPPFWDKRGLSKNISFEKNLIESLPCYSLSFRKDKEIIDFVRKIK